MDLRSLKDGYPHPKANLSTLTPDYRPAVLPIIKSTFTVKTMGNFLGILFKTVLQGITVTTLLVVWDWTTGNTIRVTKHLDSSECN